MRDSFIFSLTIELIIGFIALLISVKIIGKRQFHQVSPFDFISAIVLGELLGNAIYDKETNFFHILYGVFLWTVLLLIIEKVTLKSLKIRRAMQGSPVLIIKDGLIDYKALKKEKIDFGELLSMLREKDTFSIREVEYALLEPNGSITVIKKPPYSYPKNKELHIVPNAISLNIPLIIDGVVEEKNLKMVGYDKSWLVESIKSYEIESIKDVLYAEWSNENGFYIQRKQ